MLFDPLTRHVEFMPDWSWPLLHVLWIVGGTLFLLLHERKPVTTIAWLLAFWSVPLLSGIAYFLFGPRYLDREKGARQKAKQATDRASPARREDEPPGFDAEPLAAIARATVGGVEPSVQPSRADALTLYETGEELYPALERAIEEATDTLHLEYYIWQPDGIGTRPPGRSRATGRRRGDGAARHRLDRGEELHTGVLEAARGGGSCAAHLQSPAPARAAAG